MRSTLVKVAATAAIVALGTSACGGGSDESADSDSDAVRVQVEEICADRALSFADRGEFPVADFEPENPDPADLPAVGEYFAQGLEGTQPEALAALKKISAVGEQREPLDALIDAWETEYESAKTQVDAALASDVDGFVATLDDAAASNAAVADAASALGVSDCGSG
jgi:hypothetical protein